MARALAAAGQWRVERGDRHSVDCNFDGDGAAAARGAEILAEVRADRGDEELAGDALDDDLHEYAQQVLGRRAGDAARPFILEVE